MKSPKKITLSKEETETLINRIKQGKTNQKDQKTIIGLINFCMWLQNTLERSKITISNLRKILGFHSEKRKKKKNKDKDGSSMKGKPSNGSESKESPTNLENPEEQVNKDSIQGHGRNPASVYSGASTVVELRKDLKSGLSCPNEPACKGKVYLLQEPGVFISVEGHALASATRYELQRFRCNLCGEVFTAELPDLSDRANPKDRYDYAIKSILAISRYYMGLPFNRIAGFQKFVGVPIANTTQWDLVETVADKAYPVYLELEQLAANGDLLFLDDTKVKILSLLQENSQGENKRKGMFSTGILSHYEEHRIYLFYSGRNHAGENLEELLQHRDGALGLILQMCDASSCNDVSKEIQSILCNCLSHARRKFDELTNFFPKECEFVLDIMAKVYHFDNQSKLQQMDKDTRLAYHQTHSGPLMKLLLVYLQDRYAAQIEENSRLGEAISYTINHWNTLTTFLQIPGAPLDNNIIEQALKILIRMRKASYFFKTTHSAKIGCILLSLIYTCCMNGYNPIDYLNALQKYAKEVRTSPSNWFPWNYQLQPDLPVDSLKVA